MDSTAEPVKRGPGRPPRVIVSPTPPVAPPEPITPEAEKLHPVRLLKNYKPRGAYRIVGEMAAPPRPGLNFPNKIWAGTVIALPRDEALALIDHKVRTVEKMVDDSGRPISRDGRPVTHVIERRFPLAERADAFPS